MGKTESGNESVGYQPRAVWKQVKSVFLSAVRIPPVLDAYYAQIT